MKIKLNRRTGVLTIPFAGMGHEDDFKELAKMLHDNGWHSQAEAVEKLYDGIVEVKVWTP